MTSTAAIRFSLIVPARNEEAYLPRLLDSVETARQVYRQGPAAIEVVVADNASTDATARIAHQRGCRVVRVERRIIAAVRNGGARAAAGQILAFVDADMRIHPETFDHIENALATGRVVAGATGVRLERMSLGLAVSCALLVPLVWATGMDTGVVFCAREDFAAVGGYDETLRFAEDVRFLLDLRRLGRSRGRGLVRVTRAKAIASTRKFDHFGEWHYLTLMLKAPYLLLARRAADDFAQRYWYDDPR